MYKRLIMAHLLATMIFLPYHSAMAEYGDIVMNKSAKLMREAEVDDVLFPHWFHRIRYKCKVCHEAIFDLKAGVNDYTMKKMEDGESCGACHDDKIAWAPDECEVCHSIEPGLPGGAIQNVKKEGKKEPIIDPNQNKQ